MIVQVWRRAVEADIAPVIVACDGEEIAAVIRDAGGVAVVTDADLPSGSDRVWQAICRVDEQEQHDIIINLQGDLPTLDSSLLPQLLAPLELDEQGRVDIVTLAAVITEEVERTAISVVKPVIALDSDKRRGRALYFSRSPVPWGEGELYHHIGIYAYRRGALKRFVALPPSPLELREKLEQLRALEAGMWIDCVIVDTVPLGVDTAEDLARARRMIDAPRAK
jgi:3-deoxy-manno-octulosonate cytidylyltransferase (CMP-KDO synthetase)